MGTKRFFLFCYLHWYVFSGKAFYNDFFFFFLTNNLRQSHQGFLEKSPPFPESVTYKVVAFPYWANLHGSRRRNDGREVGGWYFTTWFLQYKLWLHWMSRSSKDTWPSLSDTLQSELKQSEILTNASRKENLAVALVSLGNPLGPTSWSLKGQEVRKHPLLALLPPLGTQPKAQRLYFLGSKITADGDCSHEFKRCLLLGRKLWRTQTAY